MNGPTGKTRPPAAKESVMTVSNPKRCAECGSEFSPCNRAPACTSLVCQCWEDGVCGSCGGALKPLNEVACERSPQQRIREWLIEQAACAVCHGEFSPCSAPACASLVCQCSAGTACLDHGGGDYRYG